MLRYPEGAGQPPPTPEPLPDAGPGAPLLREGARLTCLPLGVTQFLYSPALLGVLPEQAALTVLARSLRDRSPEVRVLGLQGLGNILFHPEKVRGAPRRAHKWLGLGVQTRPTLYPHSVPPSPVAGDTHTLWASVSYL